MSLVGNQVRRSATRSGAIYFFERFNSIMNRNIVINWNQNSGMNIVASTDIIERCRYLGTILVTFTIFHQQCVYTHRFSYLCKRVVPICRIITDFLTGHSRFYTTISGNFAELSTISCDLFWILYKIWMSRCRYCR